MMAVIFWGMLLIVGALGGASAGFLVSRRVDRNVTELTRRCETLERQLHELPYRP